MHVTQHFGDLQAGKNTNETIDLSKPHLRPIFRCIIFLIILIIFRSIIIHCHHHHYHHLIISQRNPPGLATILVFYSLLIALGLLGNLLLFIMLIRKRLYRWTNYFVSLHVPSHHLLSLFHSLFKLSFLSQGPDSVLCPVNGDCLSPPGQAPLPPPPPVLSPKST